MIKFLFRIFKFWVLSSGVLSPVFMFFPSFEQLGDISRVFLIFVSRVFFFNKIFKKPEKNFRIQWERILGIYLKYYPFILYKFHTTHHWKWKILPGRNEKCLEVFKIVYFTTSGQSKPFYTSSKIRHENPRSWEDVQGVTRWGKRNLQYRTRRRIQSAILGDEIKKISTCWLRCFSCSVCSDTQKFGKTYYYSNFSNFIRGNPPSIRIRFWSYFWWFVH